MSYLLWYVGCGLLTTLLFKLTSKSSDWQGYGPSTYFFLVIMNIFVWPAILLFALHLEIINHIPRLRKEKSNVDN